MLWRSLPKIMNGRLEHQLQFEHQNKKMLRNKPAFLKEYYRFLTASQKEETTCRTYLRYVSSFFDYLNSSGFIIKNLEEINTRHVMDYMSTLRYVGKDQKNVRQSSHAYRANVWAALNSFFNYCLIVGSIKKNPMNGVQKDSAKKDYIERIAMTPDELAKIINNIKEKINFDIKTEQNSWKIRDLCIISLFIFTGMRVTALTEININDINFSTNEITIIDKNEKTHVYVLLDQVVDFLKKWIECRKDLLVGYKDTEALFISNRRKRIADRTVRELTYKYTSCLNYNRKISPHKFRSSYATNLYNATGDIYFTKNCIGHSRVDTTERYIVDATEDKLKAKNILNQGIKI